MHRHGRNETRNAERKKRVEDENAVRQRKENAAAAKAARLEALRNIAAGVCLNILFSCFTSIFL